MAHQQEQSVALQLLHNLTAHTTLPWTGQHSAASSQNLRQNYLIYTRYHLKLHLTLRNSELLDVLLALSFTYFRGVAHELQAETQYLCLSIIQI